MRTFRASFEISPLSDGARKMTPGKIGEMLIDLLDGDDWNIDDLSVIEVNGGRELEDPLDALDRGNGPVEFSESPRGREALHRWAERYDDLNGAPEGDFDR